MTWWSLFAKLNLCLKKKKSCKYFPLHVVFLGREMEIMLLTENTESEQKGIRKHVDVFKHSEKTCFKSNQQDTFHWHEWELHLST